MFPTLHSSSLFCACALLASCSAVPGSDSEHDGEVATSVAALTTAAVQVVRAPESVGFHIANASATTTLSTTQVTVDDASSVLVLGTFRITDSLCWPGNTPGWCPSGSVAYTAGWLQWSIYDGRGTLVKRASEPAGHSLSGASQISNFAAPYTLQDSATLQPGTYTIKYEYVFGVSTNVAPPQEVKFSGGNMVFMKL